MSFKDVFKKSFLEGYAGENINSTDIAMALLFACILAIYVFLVYRVITRKTFYSKNFNISLVALAILTTAIILTIQSSIVVSLGMVGALSIVRFRTAIKEPLDLVFLFWSISLGIICGTGLIKLAILVSLLLTILILVLDKIPMGKSPMILVINADMTVQQSKKILDVVKRYSRYYRVKSRNISSGELDMVIEVRTRDDEELISEMSALENIHSVSLLAHSGEVTY